MQVFNLAREQAWDPKHHVEKILGTLEGGDYTVACWEPGQISPNHCHPFATEIYFCFSGGGKMRLPSKTIDVVPGSFCVHPPGGAVSVEIRANGGAAASQRCLGLARSSRCRTRGFPTSRSAQRSPNPSPR